MLQIRGYFSCMVILAALIVLVLRTTLQSWSPTLPPQPERGGYRVLSALPSTISLELVRLGPFQQPHQ